MTVASAIDTAPVREYLLGLQARIVGTLQAEDGKAFLSDGWQRPAGGKLEGDGLSQLVEEGGLLERGGCNFSHVKGAALPPSATQHRAELAGAPFEALGVSLVMHPRCPYVPTVHMNVRLLAAFPAGQPAKYPRFKRWCDDYFFLKHRNEPRGVGGIFFDDFNEGGFDTGFAMMRAVGDAFLPAYVPITQRRRDTPYGERERDFQAYRRGRYVEFNLVWDRGTHFGLHGGGRTESILMSMPPVVKWRYDWRPEPGTPEARLYADFLRPRDWAAE